MNLLLSSVAAFVFIFITVFHVVKTENCLGNFLELTVRANQGDETIMNKM